MTWFASDAPEAVVRPGRARASRAQVIAQSHSVVAEEPDKLVVRRWLCGTIATWRKVGTGRDAVFELVDEVPSR